ncbi:hypothetical protein BH09PLA1_BH09PLA1_00360 [soil metagenome]
MSFDFENVPIHTPPPLDVAVDRITGHLSATGQGFSIQDPNSSIGLTPAGFSGNCISPNSVFPADLLVAFSQALNDFSILYASQELATDSAATMRVTANMIDTFVGTNTAVADQPGTWPCATLAIGAEQGFNRVVVHFASRPPMGGDYGPIFVADNMDVTSAAVPESTVFSAVIGAAIGSWLIRTRRVRN